MKRLDPIRTATWAATLILAACSQSPKPVEQSSADDAVRPAGLNPDSLPAPGETMVFPWSVVPGGVGTREAAQKAVDQDPVVKEHYAAVNVAKLRTEQLAKPKSAYVSYRKGDSIFWTRNPVLLKAGETVLTDGDSLIRGRCGNMVSETPRAPVAPVHLEPPAAAMDVAIPASRLVAAIPPALSDHPMEPRLAVTDRSPQVSTAILPTPSPHPTMPGYAPQNASGGFVPIAGGPGGGSPASLGPPPESTEQPSTPQQPYVPPVPLVITPMTPPTLPPGPRSFQPPPDWPTHWYPPPQDPPLPPPPVYYPPPDHPPQPPPPYHPPSHPPPGNPPPYHPPGNPPPGNPPPHHPPGNPPPGHPPPPSDPPPHFPPPPFDPPFDPPPPDQPPPAIPEPAAFVLIGLGMIGLSIHLARQRY